MTSRADLSFWTGASCKKTCMVLASPMRGPGQRLAVHTSGGVCGLWPLAMCQQELRKKVAAPWGLTRSPTGQYSVMQAQVIDPSLASSTRACVHCSVLEVLSKDGPLPSWSTCPVP